MVFILLVLISDLALTKLNLIPLNFPKKNNNPNPVCGFNNQVLTIEDEKIDSINKLQVAFIGDSHHTYMESYKKQHQSHYLNTFLDSNSLYSTIISLGTPRYSPVQEMLAHEYLIDAHYEVDAIVFLCYAGNDFAELIRNDDRPSINFSNGTPVLRPPNWLMLRPDSLNTRWPKDSRVLYGLNGFSKNNLLLKTIAAANALDALNPSLKQRLKYLLDLPKMSDTRFGYRGAAASQFLNQYYIYLNFKETFIQQVSNRMTYFFSEASKRFPHARLYLFLLPTAPSMGAMSAKNEKVFLEILKNMEINEPDFYDFENEMFELLQDAAAKAKDSRFNLYHLGPVLKNEITLAETPAEYYDEPTLHIDAKARKVVGEYIASIILKDFPVSNENKRD